MLDLRGFSENSSGCIFELQQLTTQQRLDDTVFVVDASTDLKLLELTVGTVRGKADTFPRLRLEKVESRSAAERERVA